MLNLLRKPLSQFMFLAMLASSAAANQDLISVFPLDRYDQSVSRWIRPDSHDYDASLLSDDAQQKRMAVYQEHWFGSQSPWNEAYVSRILQQAPPGSLKAMEVEIIKAFSNQNKPDEQKGYGENFRLHTQEWIDRIAENMQLSQFDNLSYNTGRRGIAIDNLHARALPTDDVHFYSYQLAGQGYPFDNLQMSALWAGTPVYIIAESVDHAWSLVITPDYIAWVKSNGIAKVDNAFINTWQTTAKKNLAAITRTQTSVMSESGQFYFSAYVGSVFPAANLSSGIRIMIPVMSDDRRAVIKYAVLGNEDAAMMPLSATPHHFANIMRTMISRPYGWGGLYFYNDCSAELKSVFTPFGIWLPRHSSAQVTEGRLVDMSAASSSQRLSYLLDNGKKFMTLVYIGGHVFLYVGQYSDADAGNQAQVAMTYQNIWGLSPGSANRRAVIGSSVLFPLLQRYPEDMELMPLTAKKYFQVSFLDQWPSSVSLRKSERVDLRALMYPEKRPD